MHPQAVNLRSELSPEALSEEIRSLDEERPPVAAHARRQLTRDRILKVVLHVVVVAGVESGARTWRPAKQQLAAQA